MPFIKYKQVNSVRCTYPEHNPPTNMMLNDGEHTWICPACHCEQVIMINRPTL